MDIFNSIPHSNDAFLKQEQEPVDQDVLVRIAEVFRNYGQETRLKVILNHRHFELQPGEKLVGRGLVAAPWQLDDAPEQIKERISGTAWAFVNGGLQPYEFAFEDEPSEEYQVPAGLSSEVYSILSANNMVERLGIGLYDPLTDGDDVQMYERTFGRVNTMVKKDIEAKHIIPVGWVSDGPGQVKRCTLCRNCRLD